MNYIYPYEIPMNFPWISPWISPWPGQVPRGPRGPRTVCWWSSPASRSQASGRGRTSKVQWFFGGGLMVIS